VKHPVATACLALLVVQPAGAQVPTPKVVPDAPSCPRCTITVRTIVTLGTDDGLGSLNGRPMSVNVDSRGRWWVFQELEPPTVFGANGVVDRMIGRKGSGPGEFQSANNGILVGDSMLVFDWLQSRATMVGADLKPGRTIRIMQGMGDIILIDWPSLLVTQAHVQGSNPANSALHRLSLAGPEMRWVGSFGPRGTGGGPMGNAEVYQNIGWAPDGIWSAWAKRPEFAKFDRSGVMQASFTRRFGWFTGEKPTSLGTPTTPPTPRTGPITEDAEGLVWLFIHQPAPTWKEGWANARPTAAGRGTEYRGRDFLFDRMFNTYVEVIDPVTARVVARHTIPGYVFEALPGRRVGMYGEDMLGIPRVRIVQLELNGR
jgi:hypothetical protein